jgi:SulP family sulfate permease
MGWEALQGAEIFEGLSRVELDGVDGISEIKDYPEGEPVFIEGDNGDEIYVLLKGKVVIEMQMKTKGEKALVHTVIENQVFGEFALIDGEPRSASATACKPSKLLVVPIADFNKLMEANPRIGYVVMRNFNRILCTRIRKTNRDLRASLMWQ